MCHKTMIFLYIPETRGDSILLESGNLNETKLSQEPAYKYFAFLWIPRWGSGSHSVWNQINFKNLKECKYLTV